MSYILKAKLSRAGHPELGQTTVCFPIPESEYDQTVEQLEQSGMGDALRQDCRVEEVDSWYSILGQLEGSAVGLDELDYLAKRMESFDGYEAAQFQGMAHKLGLTDIKDFINLTFCCQQATVITSFSDLEQLGKDHRMTLNGGMMPMDQYQAVDGRKEALRLIQSGSGTVTPFGVVYDNGMVLEPVYDGQHFPAYLYNAPRMMLEVKSPEGSEYLYLPAPDRQIQRTLLRAGDPLQLRVELDELPEEISSILDLNHLKTADLDGLNQLCRSVSFMQDGPAEPYQREMEQAML